MPELPEVETISRGLDKKVRGLTIRDFWTDWPKSIKIPKNLKDFKREIIGRKILKVYRKGKNILFDLSGDKLLLIHQKLTGHLLYGKWKIKKVSSSKYWVVSLIKGPLEEKVNNYIHLIFYFNNGWQIGLSDLRKLAKIMAGEKEKIENLPDLKNLGPDSLGVSFEKFSEILGKEKGRIKSVLMDQEVLSGIGNIYSDEILWFAKIHPFKPADKLNKDELKRVYSAIISVLKEAVKLRGTSISDYRDISGKIGGYEKIRKVYQREGEPCPRCQTPIKRVKIGSRSAHFCPACQRLKP